VEKKSPPPRHKAARLPPQGEENAFGVLVKSFTLKDGVLSPKESVKTKNVWVSELMGGVVHSGVDLLTFLKII
jgi:hypothetical protein